VNSSAVVPLESCVDYRQAGSPHSRRDLKTTACEISSRTKSAQHICTNGCFRGSLSRYEAVESR
jgi:hypothetical protein